MRVREILSDYHQLHHMVLFCRFSRSVRVIFIAVAEKINPVTPKKSKQRKGKTEREG